MLAYCGDGDRGDLVSIDVETKDEIQIGLQSSESGCAQCLKKSTDMVDTTNCKCRLHCEISAIPRYHIITCWCTSVMR
jgi:hypothetical protein